MTDGNSERSRRLPRLPPEQQRELEKDGRIKRFLCDVLRLRVLAYIAAQPAGFTFIVSLFLVALCMPFIGVYIKNAGKLPDLDSMRYWNSYLGKLSSKKLCIDTYTGVRDCPQSTYANNTVTSGTVGVKLTFTVEKSVVENGPTHLLANLTGESLKTKIKDNVTGNRIDRNVTLRIHMDFSNVNTSADCSSSHCTVEACVSIKAPMTAIPMWMPPVHKDFSFGTRVFHSPRRPTPCNCSAVVADVGGLTLCEGGEVSPGREKYRHHGLIVIYLNESDLSVSSSRLTLFALVVAVMGIAFAIGISCTDRPPQPKPSSE